MMHVKERVLAMTYWALACVCNSHSVSARVNIAVNGIAKQSTTLLYGEPDPFNWTASLAIDGHKSGRGDINTEPTCSGTGLQNYPWWNVDLNTDHNIGKINIYGRLDNTGNLLGFRVFLTSSESSRILAGDLVHKDNITASQYKSQHAIYQIVTSHRGRFIYIDLPKNKSHLVLCEVEVYEVCPVYTYGDGEVCAECGFCKDYIPCRNNDGTCPNGCAPGYLPDMCNRECSKGYYGQNCENICGQCLNNDPCDNVNGSCTQCDPGYKGQLCVEECDDFSYGYRCKKGCGNCKDDIPCNHINGTCKSCKAGFYLPLCTKACSNDRYGENCSFKCGHCKANEVCNKRDGQCSACADGYAGALCNNVCPAFSYGENCQHICGHCRNEATCNHKTGLCNSCAAGYNNSDTYCKTECSDYFYGYLCRYKCGHCKNNISCNKINGTCSLGCSIGYEGDTCNSECSGQKFGEDCSNICHCKDDAKCNVKTGYCPQGQCGEGWGGPDCNTACNDGYYGVNCSELCGYCANNVPCDRTTGHSESGCVEKHKGPRCKSTCLFGTYGINCSLECGHCADNKTCHTETGHCLSGCADDWTGETCRAYVSEHPMPNVAAIASGAVGSLVAVAVLVVIIFIVWRRIKQTAVLRELESAETMAMAPAKIYTALSQGRKDDTEHDYEDIQASNTPVKQFPNLYKTLLSTRTDGNTVLFHAFQSLRATEPEYPEYHNTELNRTEHSGTLNMTYKDLVAKNECSSTSETSSMTEGFTQIVKMDSINFIVSSDDASHDRFWKAAAVHSTAVCFHIGKVAGPLSLDRGGRLNTENFAIVCSSLKRRKSAVHRKLSVKSLDSSSSVIIEVISYGTWEDMEDIPVDLMSLLDMVNDISILQRKQKCLMIHSEQTIHKPVMLAVATAVLMEMEDTGFVDILGHTKAAWRAVPTSMATYEQFRFLHDIVLLAVRKKRFINRKQ